MRTHSFMDKKVKHNEISGRIISISKENDKSIINIVIEKGKVEVEAKESEYNLGEKVDMDVKIKVTKIKKKLDNY